MEPGACPLDLARHAGGHHRRPKGDCPGPAVRPLLDRALPQVRRQWAVAERPDAGLHKRHGLQGPIDDAFLDSFIFVSPTGTPLAPEVAKWVASEEKRAIAEWRRQFRGDAQVRDDKDITDADIANSNLDPLGRPGQQSRAGAHRGPPAREMDRRGIVPARALRRRHARADPDLPQSAEPEKIRGAEQRLHLPRCRLCSNARQTPKLPDYAIVDITVPPTPASPAKSCRPASSTKTGRCSAPRFLRALNRARRRRSTCFRSACAASPSWTPKCARGWKSRRRLPLGDGPAQRHSVRRERHLRDARHGHRIRLAAVRRAERRSRCSGDRRAATRRRRAARQDAHHGVRLLRPRARRAIRDCPATLRAAVPRDRRPRWRPGWSRSRWARRRWARCCGRRRTAASAVSSPASD